MRKSGSCMKFDQRAIKTIPSDILAILEDWKINNQSIQSQNKARKQICQSLTRVWHCPCQGYAITQGAKNEGK